MTRPLSHVRQKIIAALVRHGRPFASRRDLAVAAGLIDETTARGSGKMRTAQHAVAATVKAGLITASIGPDKINNAYRLSPAGRTVAATLFTDAIKRSSAEHHPESRP